MTRRIPRDDGVSTVIGAILIAGLLVTALVTTQVTFVPVWQKDAESDRFVSVEGQLTQLISDIERQVDNRSSTSLAHPFSLGQRSSGFFGGPDLPDTVELRSTTGDFVTEANQLLLLQGNGQNFAGLNPVWTPVPGSTTVSNVVRVDALRLRVDHIDFTDDGDYVELQVRDSTSVLVGTFRLDVTNPSGPSSAGSSYYITVTTTDETTVPPSIVTSVTYSHHNQVEFTPYYEDALNAVYLFDQIIASATTPLQIAIEHAPGFDADYNIAYVEAGPGGLPVLVGSSGILRVPYEATYNGRSFTYDVQTRRMPPATYVIEHGALIMEQNEGAAFKVIPAFTAERSNDFTSLSFNIPSLAGDPFVRSGTANAVIVTKATNHRDIVANAPRFYLTIDTQYPDLWDDFFTDTLTTAGLDQSAGQFDIARYPDVRVANEDQIVVEIYGATSATGSLFNDVSITLNQATVTLSAVS